MVVDSIGAQRRIHSRLAPENEVARSSEAASIEPAVEPNKSVSRAGLIARRQHIGPRSGSKQGHVVCLTIAEYQRESPLKSGDTIDTPSANNSVQAVAYMGEIVLALPEWEV